jgi:hypothetical protein
MSCARPTPQAQAMLMLDMLVAGTGNHKIVAMEKLWYGSGERESVEEEKQFFIQFQK